MTNSIAVVLGLFIIAVIAADVWFYDSEHLLILGKKFLEFENWVAFWR